ncbi:3-phosphoshikimate 1-carboxyvinyltransferase [Inediibacterium massiliense]|uniref:3-phosphoshikimate 1-carboxyvinyltransferase n=1 Tax=Inediibacterium massiliense TaxID=1658111 RepID=UPI0006B69F7E|nr:3-phosphoshikimate 1-carboxyvinyltransferase [Inediibacterium massiliense]
MDTIKILPSVLNGKVKIPPSKSMSHRAIICAALAHEESLITHVSLSDDILATLEGVEALGAKVNKRMDDDKTYSIRIEGAKKIICKKNKIDCKESGSTLRFLIPIGILTKDEMTFTGRGKLMERPLHEYYKIFEKQDIKYDTDNGKLPLTIKGNLKGDIFKVRGDVSSQFITGLLFALPLLKEDSKIIVTTSLESKSYIDLTIQMMSQFGVDIKKDKKDYWIQGNQEFKPSTYKVEGDFSQGAFFMVAGILGGNIRCMDLLIDSLQGDKAIIDIIKKMGGEIFVEGNDIVTKASKTHGITIDVSQCPDLVPAICVLASLSKGTTKIVNAKRLRIKESDRLKAMATELNKLGGCVKEFEDGLEIVGKESLIGGEVDSWNDHRIAMALGIVSIRCKHPVVIKNSHAVKKSYPEFWEDFKRLGGKIHE